MADLVVLVGQTLSLIGLGYGWYLSLLWCGDDSEIPTVLGDAKVLNYLALAWD